MKNTTEAEWTEKLEEYKTSDEVMEKVCIDGLDHEWPVEPIVVIDYEEDTDSFSCYHIPRVSLRECDRDGKGVCYTECVTVDDLSYLGFETEEDIEAYRKTWKEEAGDWEPEWTDLRWYVDFFEEEE